eukprot:scaffold86574_cov36-Tisochrysis_lutea.AAC.1
MTQSFRFGSGGHGVRCAVPYPRANELGTQSLSTVLRTHSLERLGIGCCESLLEVSFLLRTGCFFFAALYVSSCACLALRASAVAHRIRTYFSRACAWRSSMGELARSMRLGGVW